MSERKPRKPKPFYVNGNCVAIISHWKVISLRTHELLKAKDVRRFAKWIERAAKYLEANP